MVLGFAAKGCRNLAPPAVSRAGRNRRIGRKPLSWKPVRSDYRVGEHNVRVFGLDVHNPVFMLSGTAIVVFVAFALITLLMVVSLHRGLRAELKLLRRRDAL